MLFDHFDRIRIINLASRNDRRKEMLQELQRAGLIGNPKVEFFNARRFDALETFPSLGSRGAFHSHLDILTEAASANESVLILEDDVDFTSSISSYELPEAWDMFYGGYITNNLEDIQKSDIIGAHFMGFTAKTAKRASEYLRASLSIQPEDTCRYVDGAYVWFRRANPDILTVFANPVVGYQRPSATDCSELNWFDRTPLVKHIVRLARGVKRRLKRLVLA